MTKNPLMLFKTHRNLSALIEQANRLAGPDKRWSLAFTNCSFIVACVAFVAAEALMLGQATAFISLYMAGRQVCDHHCATLHIMEN